jgi:hypothetical protein
MRCHTCFGSLKLEIDVYDNSKGLSCAGKPFWLVKNEWSKYWGNNGFIKIDMQHDCAITAQAFFVELQ